MRQIFIYALLFIFVSKLANAKEGQLQFITNGHQWPSQVHYKADVQGGAVFLTNTGFTYSYYSLEDIDRIHELKDKRSGPASDVAGEVVNFHAYSVTMQGGNVTATTVPQRKLSNYYNYFQGNDPSRWSGGLAAYEGVRYKDIYSGIDLNVYSKGVSLKYDFILAPGADAGLIRMDFKGVAPTLTAAGDLSIKTSVNELIEKAPYAYQVVNGIETKVACRYVLKDGKVSFVFPDGYDQSRDLVIDPVLVFATYSGATSTTYGWSATYDLSGNLYAGGESFGAGWPVTTGAFQSTFGGAQDVGINKYSSTGTNLIYSTYYGGSAGDYPNNMVVNASGELVVAGATLSSNLPVTTGCFDNTLNGGSDVYVAHFNATGTALIGSTYVGGSGSEGNVSTAGGYDANRGEVYTDPAGNIYVAAGTNSANFPTTAGAYQTALSGTMDAFIFKMNSTCTNLVFSTYLGGSANDAALAILLNSAGNIVVCGATTSSNFPGAGSGWQASLQGSTDGFIAVLNSTGTALLNATYVGTPGADNVSKIQIDPSDNIYAMGVNNGTFPVTAGNYSVPNGKIYFAKFNPALNSLLNSTVIGSGTVATTPSAFLLDVCGNLYYVGYGAGTGLPVTPNAFLTTGGFWMCVVSNNMGTFSYGSYFGTPGDHIDGGSSRLDPQGIVYHSICTASSTQPTTPSSWCPSKLSPSWDIASWKFHFQAIGVTAGLSIGSTTDTFCAPAVVNLVNTSSGGQTYTWNFGDNSPTSNLTTPPAHTYATPGTYRVTLYAYNAGSCAGVDSAFHNIVVRSDSVHAHATLTTNDSGCAPYTVAFTNTSVSATSYQWIWGDNTPNGTTATPTHTYISPGTYTISFIAISAGICHTHDTVKFVVTALIPGADASFTISGNDTFCMPGAVQVTNTSTGATNYAWNFGDGSPTVTSTNPPAHNYTAPGSYTIKLFAYNTNYWACIPVDSAFHSIYIRADSVHAHANLTTNDSGCAPYTIAFNNTSTGATSYEWIWGDNTPNGTTASPTHTYPNTGTYTIRMIAINPLNCHNRDTILFTVTSLIPGADAAFTIAGNDSLCLPASVQANNASAGATNYSWDFGDGTPAVTSTNPPVHTYTAAGTYTIRLHAYNTFYWACIPVDSAEQVVHIFDIRTPILSVHDTLVCVPDRIDISVGIANYVPTMSIAWTPAGLIFTDPTRATVTVDATRDQLYTVTVTNSVPGICSVDAAATVHVNLWNKLVYEGDTLICPRDTVQLRVAGSYDSVRWEPSLYLSDPTSLQPMAFPPMGISYVLLGKYHHCVDTERTEIRIAPGAFVGLPDSVTIYPGDSYQMSPNTNCLYFSWFPYNGLSNPNISNPVAMPAVNTRYYINASTKLGCKTKDSIVVMVDPESYLDVPNAFAPGNGSNGLLRIVHTGTAKLKSFQVFDRWGIRVFQGADINDGWDGTYKGTPQPMGVYVYMAEAVTPSGRRFYKQGNVTLIR